MFKSHMLYKILVSPIVTAEHHIVNGGVGLNRDLKCAYKAFPRAEVQWFFNAKQINTMNSNKYKINNTILPNNDKYTSQSILTLSDINDDDLGKYTCVVQNVEGKSEANVELTYAPEPPHYVGSEIHGKNVAVNWTVASYIPLQDVILYYKYKNNKEWQRQVNLTKDQDADSKLWK